MAATLRDVARRAGVAVSTASLALNGSASVKPATRERVLQAASELRYRPNAVARSLVTQHTKTIGLLLPDIGDPYYHEIFRGVDEWARCNEYSVVLAHTSRQPVEEARYLELLMRRQVEGIIFAGAGICGDRHLAHLEQERFPIVLIGRHDLDLPSIVANNEAGAYQVVKHLLELGHRDIAMLAGPPALTTAEDRLGGYKRALAEHSVPLRPELVVETDFTPEGGSEAMRELLDGRRPFSAVFAANDQLAFGAIQALRAAGLAIPEEISVAGFGDIPLSRFLYPALTTVRIPLRQVGKEAAQMLAQVAAGEGVAESGKGVAASGGGRLHGSRLISVELVVRASTGPASSPTTHR